MRPGRSERRDPWPPLPVPIPGDEDGPGEWAGERDAGLPICTGQRVSPSPSTKLVGLKDRGGREGGGVSRALPLPTGTAFPADAGEEPGEVISVPTLPGANSDVGENEKRSAP